MKLVADEYKPNEIFRILREWTGLTQEELGKKMGKKGRSWAKEIESGKNRYYFNDLLEIAKEFDITITMEKKSKSKK